MGLFFRGEHTETVDVEYDEKVTSYDDLLKTFWKNHDSTQCHTRQYMSAIFYHDEDQEIEAKKSMEEKQKRTARKIVTKILPADKFYNAEE